MSKKLISLKDLLNNVFVLVSKTWFVFRFIKLFHYLAEINF